MFDVGLREQVVGFLSHLSFRSNLNILVPCQSQPLVEYANRQCKCGFEIKTRYKNNKYKICLLLNKSPQNIHM